MDNLSISAFILIALSILILWGLIQPILSFFLLKVSTRIDNMTAAAISASFGSVSVMTFVTALSFLDQLAVDYQKLVIAILAIMEVPAIISGLMLAKIASRSSSLSIHKTLVESIFNKVIFTLFIGLVMGTFLPNMLRDITLFPFKPALSLFLFDMGLYVGLQRAHFRYFSWSLNLFGIYMPLIGGTVGLLLSYILKLDVGTGTLIAVLTASASYIAVPAAMRTALPEAKEAIYLPLSLGIAFPFNVIIGIPLFYYLASLLLV